MHKLPFILVILLVPFTIAAQQQAIRHIIPNDPSLHGPLFNSSKEESERETAGGAPSPKGASAQSFTWDAIIAREGHSVDGGTIRCMVSDSDNIYIAGDFRTFDTVPADFLVHYNRKSGVWESLDLGFNNRVNALALHKGTLYVGGAFQFAGSGGTTVNYIAAWNGSWHDIGGGVDGEVYALAFVGDTLFAGGYFQNAGSNPASYLAMWDGFSWTQAGGGVSYPVEALYSTHDSLFVGGRFTYVGNGTNRSNYIADGIAMLRNGKWTTFGNAFDGSVLSITIFQGKLWAAGDFFHSRDLSSTYFGMATWNGTSWVNYGKDTTFGVNASGSVIQLLPIGDTLLALGQFTSMGGVPANSMAIYHNNTWSSFGGGMYGYARSGVFFNNQLWVGGRFTAIGGSPINNIASFANGTWSKIGSGLGPHNGWESDRVAAIAVGSRYVFVGGNFTTVDNKVANHIAAWDKQTRTWTTLGNGVDGEVYSLTLKGDTLLVGGDFNYAGSIPAQHIALYDINAAQWHAMGSGSIRNISSIAVHNDSIYATVFFSADPPYYNNHIGVWNGTNWIPYGGPFVGFPEALLWKRDTLYAAGTIDIADGGAVNNIAAYYNGAWNSLNGGVDNTIYALALGPDGQLYAGGDFLNADGMLAFYIAAWDGTAWNTLGNGLDNSVFALTRANDGVYIGGNFGLAGTTLVHNLTHWNGKTFLDVAGGVNNSVNAMGTDASNLYLGGWMEGVGTGNTPSFHFASLKGAGADVTSVAIDRNEFSVYPNPSTGVLTIQLPQQHSGAITVEILNTLGEKVRSIELSKGAGSSDDLSIDAGSLPNGSYFLRLVNAGSVGMQPFIIEK